MMSNQQGTKNVLKRNNKLDFVLGEFNEFCRVKGIKSTPQQWVVQEVEQNHFG